MKKRVSATVDKKTIDKINKILKNSNYRNKSHVIEEAIRNFKGGRKKVNDRGQVAVFVIATVFLIGAIALFLLIDSRFARLDIDRSEFNPENFIDQCVRQNTRDSTDIMITQGGFVNPQNYVTFKDMKVTYLCENINYYETCVNQYPVYLSSIEKEIENSLRPEVEGCFIQLEEELKKRNIGFSANSEAEISAVLKPGVIEVKTSKDFTIEENGAKQNFDSLTTSLRSPLYELASTASEIVSQEAKFCNFEYVGFSILYNSLNVKKTSLGDSTKIYSIQDKESGKEMNLAVRGCAIPAGI